MKLVMTIVRKANNVVGCVWAIAERKWGGFFKRMIMFDSMVGMEGIRGGRVSARKIFEMGGRSGWRNAMLHSEGRVQEE
jgi:hypothetical protein